MGRLNELCLRTVHRNTYHDNTSVLAQRLKTILQATDSTFPRPAKNRPPKQQQLLAQNVRNSAPRPVRSPFPNRIVWKQDDVISQRFYWLSIDPDDIRERALVIATREAQNFDIQSKDVDQITIRFNDAMIDFDQPIKVTSGEKVLYEGRISRSSECVKKTFAERHDPKSVYSAEVVVNLR